MEKINKVCFPKFVSDHTCLWGFKNLSNLGWRVIRLLLVVLTFNGPHSTNDSLFWYVWSPNKADPWLSLASVSTFTLFVLLTIQTMDDFDKCTKSFGQKQNTFMTGLYYRRSFLASLCLQQMYESWYLVAFHI